ncbi:MAG: type II toxin-antitoxin system RelE/ParE family toxin [Verrucomicrobia bacterium]|nr:type II toxin-antitoxin system RelE/ParE family toxin [Verrucomicrobiota bacterium]MCH8529145.1 type II toxin-antitoxin system RelE/ParE family toxin [Kiritimatiellia bacterium]
MSSGSRVLASPLFGRKVKKLKANEKKELDAEIKRLLENPTLGQEKKGDLEGIRVHKFKMNRQQILLAYEVTESELTLLTFGSHENYYRDLKRYLN